MTTSLPEPIAPINVVAAEKAASPITATGAQVSPKSDAPECSEDDAPIDDQTFVANLALLSPFDYDRVRKEKAHELGVMVSTLDRAVYAARRIEFVADQLPFAEIESYSEPVDPGELLDEIVEIILRYIVMDKEQADAGALWIAHTHFTDVFDVSPLAIFNAPEKACAKTLAQTVFGYMSFRPLPAANATLSALFRAVELWKPTIFIDEADTFFRDNPELHGMVNAGYKRGGFVLRSEPVGDSFEPRMFPVYGPKSIAGIALEKHLPDSTMSRGIVFNLRRKMAHEKVDRLRNADSETFTVIASKLARFAGDCSQKVRLARPHLPDELSDRQQDSWEPLLAIAGCAGPAWVERATQAALKVSSAGEASVSTGNELLADIQSIFVRKAKAKVTKGELKVSTVDLIDALCKIDDAAWATYNRGKPLSPRQLAKQLATYGIKPKTVRMGDKDTPKGYDASQFEDAFARYLISPVKLSPQRNGVPDGNSGEAEGVADEMQPVDTFGDTGGF